MNLHTGTLFTLPAAGLLAVLLAAEVSPAADGTIQITLATHASATEGGVAIDLEVRNDGDAAAVDVVSTVAVRGRDVEGTAVPRLEASGRSLQTILVAVDDPEALRGTWPVLVRVPYKDQNGYAFEAVHVALVSFGRVVSRPAVSLTVSDVRLETTGSVTARLESPVPADASLTFLAAGGLAIGPGATRLTLEPGTVRRITARVDNVGATLASRLPVFAIAEYEGPQGHETAVARGFVDIGPPDRSEAGRLAVLGALVALLGLWIVVAFIRRRPAGTRRAAGG